MALEHLKRSRPTPKPALRLCRECETPLPTGFQGHTHAECVKTPSASPPKPASPKQPTVAFGCGHSKVVQYFAGQICPACRDSAKKSRNAKRREKLAAKKPPVEERLPDGSRKVLVYSAATTTWTGSLEVPGAAEAFTLSADSEKKCFQGLHALYVRWRDGKAEC